MRFFARGEGTPALELDIYDDIGDSWLFGGVSARAVRRTLRDNRDAKSIKVRINSKGGEVIEGFAIYDLLKEHPANVEISIDGIAASIASVVAMAGDEISIASGGFVMIHNPYARLSGEADELRQHADVLDRMRDTMAKAYAERSGLSIAKVIELMDAETWLNADQAKELGFVDTVRTMKKTQQRQAARAFAALRLDDYANVPAGVRLAVESAREQRSDDDADDEPKPARAEGTSTENDNGDTMNKKLLALALGILETASDEDFETGVARLAGERDAARSQLARLETLTGKTGEEAHGVLLAWKGSHAELETVSTELATLKTEKSNLELDGAIALAKQESRHTPAREEKVRKLLAAKDVSTAGAKAMVAEWGKVDAIAAARDGAIAANGGSGGGTGTVSTTKLKHNGKTYAEMTSGERKKLHDEDEEIFEQMREQAIKDGEI